MNKEEIETNTISVFANAGININIQDNFKVKSNFQIIEYSKSGNPFFAIIHSNDITSKQIKQIKKAIPNSKKSFMSLNAEIKDYKNDKFQYLFDIEIDGINCKIAVNEHTFI